MQLSLSRIGTYPYRLDILAEYEHSTEYSVSQDVLRETNQKGALYTPTNYERTAVGDYGRQEAIMA